MSTFDEHPRQRDVHRPAYPPQPTPRAWGGRPPAYRRPRRGPGWLALVVTAVLAALLASLGTLALTRAVDAARPAATQTDQGGGATTGPDDADDPPAVVTSTTDDPDWASLAAAVRPSVVAIDVRTDAGAGSGSGVLIDDEGRIVTNHHVVGRADAIVVTLSDGRLYEADIVGTDEATDLAVIRLDDPPGDLQPATLGDSEDVLVGDPVAAVGNPLGLSSTVTTGIVSALDRPVTTVEQTQQPGQQPTLVTTNAIQVDAAINPGNSGGPLFDAEGRVIGINSSIASMPGSSGQSSGNIGLGFAIPSNVVRLIGDQLVADGVAEHAFLGITMTDTTATAEGETRMGARVEGVQEGTPAEESGLRPGDVIIALDDDPVIGAASLTGFVRQYASGDEVTITFVRGDERQETTATLATREDQLR